MNKNNNTIYSGGGVSLSVVMAAYNEEKYIKEAVDSILNQTFTDFEFIIVDDGSTDKTLSILQTYTDSRIKIISRENKGVVYSRNEAIDIAEGQYIAIMDADDISLPERFSKQVEFLDGNNFFVAVGCHISRCCEKLNVVREWQYPTLTASDVSDSIHRSPQIGHACSMFVRDSLKKISGYREYFYGSEDADLFWRLDELGKLGSLQESLYKYRFNEGSISLNIISVYRRVLSDVVAGYCAKLRRSGKSDKIFNDKNLSKNNGFLLHKTDMVIQEWLFAWGVVWYKTIKTTLILMIRKIIRKK